MSRHRLAARRSGPSCRRRSPTARPARRPQGGSDNPVRFSLTHSLVIFIFIYASQANCPRDDEDGEEAAERGAAPAENAERDRGVVEVACEPELVHEHTEHAVAVGSAACSDAVHASEHELEVVAGPSAGHRIPRQPPTQDLEQGVG